MWLTNYRSSVLWHCWLGHVTRKTVSEMTYNVSSGTLNSTIPTYLYYLTQAVVWEVLFLIILVFLLAEYWETTAAVLMRLSRQFGI